MKVVVQAAIASIMIHFVYFMGTIGMGYLQTTSYQPNIEEQWENVDYLQSTVGFGVVGFPPFIYAFTLVGLALICGIIIHLYKKFSANV